MTKKSEPTVSEHMEEAKAFADHLDRSNAMTTKLRDELSRVRRTLEMLEPCQHNMIKLRMPYWIDTKNEECTPKEIIGKQIDEINKLLGDRA